MRLFYDTETNGLPDYKARSNDPKQPHLVQLALVLSDDAGAEVEAVSMLIRPDGWVITPALTKIHGISHEQAMEEGIAERDAVMAFVSMQCFARQRVAHNAAFDTRIMRIAMTRAGVERDMIEAIEARSSFCTCIAATPIVNLPPTTKMLAAGFKRAKPAKLEECIAFFFAGEKLEGAHDALVDARACARVYRALQGHQPHHQQRQQQPEPEGVLL